VNAEQIDQPASPTGFDTYPAWIGPVLRGALPEGLEPLAVYYSWEYDSRRIPALLVLPTSLVGVSIEFVGNSTVLSVTRTSIGLDDVLRVSVSMRTALMSPEMQENPMETQEVELELRQELPPFGSAIRLPLSKNDYRGDWDLWKRAARSVADALLLLGVGPPSRA
jgi:hypothetical protein